MSSTAALLALAALAGAAGPRPVVLTTVDGVELYADYWPGRGGRQAPVAVLLHDPAADGDIPDGWRELGEELSAAGWVVVRPHWRGRGRSTAVTPAFWESADNRRGVRGRGESEVTADEFRRGYDLALVNDLATVWRFVQRVNDASEADADRVVFVGAGEAASAAVLWLGTESARYRGIGPFHAVGTRPEGEGVFGTVWLAPRATLGGRTVPAAGWWRRVQRRRAVPAGVLYPEGDATAAAFARGLDDATPDRAGAQPVYAKAVTPKTDEPIDDPSVREAVRNYLGRLRDKAGPSAWREQDPDAARFYWLPRGRPPVVAKGENEELPRPVPEEWLLRP